MEALPTPALLKHVLLSEILVVTSVMRKNSRWASSTLVMAVRDTPALGTNMGLRISSPAYHTRLPGRGTREVELMAGFIELKRVVKDMEDIRQADLTDLLAPFFAILRSPLSTGPITSSALSALHSFFACGLFSPDSPSIDAALNELSSTISHCKFEASDSSGDEVVLLRIMTVIQDCLCGSVGRGLGDIEVCEMLETVLTTCCQMRLSETLRRSAEATMHTLVRMVFSRLRNLDPEEEEAKLSSVTDDEALEVELRMTVTTSKEKVVDCEVSDTPEGQTEVGIEENEVQPTVAPPTKRPEYGLPSILELLRVLVNVLDPNDQQHTDSTRLMALGILSTAFEESGSIIAQFPSLKAIVVDPGCKFLFQLARSENILVLQGALRTVATILSTMRKYLKLQQELFLTFTIDRLAPPVSQGLKGNTSVSGLKERAYSPSPRPGTPATNTPSLALIDSKNDAENATSSPSRPLVPPARGETRDLILETLGHISCHSSFMVDLFTNYDCDTNCDNLFERLIEFLTKAVYPSQSVGNSEAQRFVQGICLEILLSFVNDMATRANDDSAALLWPSGFIDTESLLQAKSKKQLILTGAARFNAKPKSGVTFLDENNLIYADLSPEMSKARSLAKFLKGCTRIDKRLLGDFISKPDNLDILQAFIGLFDFKNKPVAEAMRELLEAFRLPGESQQISRIAETFASTYFAAEPAEIKTEDAAHVLAYSIIMLNTDQHNPQIRKRMTIDDYKRNLRGVNDGSDFSPEFLQNIYDSIKKREIIMPEEHTGQLGFEYAWKELLARSRQTGEFMICNTSAFDVEMFKIVWRPVISAIAYAFISFEDDYYIQRAIAGFRQCATLAGHFNLPDVFDFVVLSLSQATSLLSDSLPAQVPNYPVIDVEGQSVTVSKLSVEFGTNFRGQLAAVVLFNIVNGNGHALREGWTQIFEMFQNLFLHSLLPTRMLQMEDFLGGVTMIPLRGGQPSKSHVRSDGGLLSALSSYLMTPYSSDMSVPDATDADVENTLSTIDCITSCRLDELYSQIIQLEAEALVAAIRALEALAHERTIAKLKIHSEDMIAPMDGYPRQLPYDPASVFLLEIMISITSQAPQYITDLWPIVFEHLSALLSSSAQYSILLIERAVVCLLRLCQILANTSRDQVYVAFDLLAGLSPTVANSVGEQVMAGLILVFQKHKDIIRSQTEWNLVFALVRSTMAHPEAARMSFDLIEALVADGPDNSVSLDNFSGLLTVLDDFATSANMLQEQQQQRGRRNEPLSSSNTPGIKRGKTAVDLLPVLHRRLSSWVRTSEIQEGQAWKNMVLPLLVILGRHSVNAAREIRHGAMSHLQRILLGSSLTSETDQKTVEEVFNRVVFPLIDELLKPQVALRDPQGMNETRLRGSALLCKVFMHLELHESRAKTDFRLLWIQVLDLLDRLMHVDRSSQLYEAVPESLKNVLLVMNAVGILVPPESHQDDLQKTLWLNTHERMERFLPGFLTDIIIPIPPPDTSPA